jgi:hypothetical protein
VIAAIGVAGFIVLFRPSLDFLYPHGLHYQPFYGVLFLLLAVSFLLVGFNFMVMTVVLEVDPSGRVERVVRWLLGEKRFPIQTDGWIRFRLDTVRSLSDPCGIRLECESGFSEEVIHFIEVAEAWAYAETELLGDDVRG